MIDIQYDVMVSALKIIKKEGGFVDSGLPDTDCRRWDMNKYTGTAAEYHLTVC